MTRKLTINISDEVYEGLHAKIGPRKIGRFLEKLARPYVIDEDLEKAYAEMAKDAEREAGAADWADTLIGDSGS